MRKHVLGLGAVVLIGALAACGQAPAGTAPAPPEKQAGSLFTDAKSLAAAATAKANEISSSRFTVETTAFGQKMTGSGVTKFVNGQESGTMTMTIFGETVEERRIDNVTTYRKPTTQERKKLKLTKPWVKEDERDKDGLLSENGPAADHDPRKALESVQEAGTITKGVGEKLDGQDVFHYWIDLDPAKMGKEFGGQPTTKLGKMPMELWLRGDQLPVKAVMDMSELVWAGAIAGGATPEELEGLDIGGIATMRFTDWGSVDVDVRAPPADEVQEMPKR